MEAQPMKKGKALTSELAEYISHYQAPDNIYPETGYMKLDSIIKGFQPGCLYVIGGRRGEGKTTLAMTIVDRMGADTTGETLVVNLETKRTEWLGKYTAMKARVDANKIRSGLLSPEETDAIVETMEKVESEGLSILDEPFLTIDLIAQYIVKFAANCEEGTKPGLIVIDYLQLITPSYNEQPEYDKVTRAVRTLKDMAKSINVPIVLLSQLADPSAKSGFKKESKIPLTGSSLRGSGTIEEDADVVILLNRENYQVTNRAAREEELSKERTEGISVVLRVEKNRFGKQGECELKFFPERMRFVEVPKEKEMPCKRTSNLFDDTPTDDENLFG